MKKNRTTKKTIYILTEGETEEAYFSRIGEIVGSDTDWQYAVTVEVREIIKGSKTDPVNIVKEARKSKKDYDEIWVVFDRDRDRDDKNEEAILIASQAKIHVAFSSISFEHWLILHFEKNNYAFQRSDCESRTTKANKSICVCNGAICAKTYLKRAALYPGFAKGKALLYDDLKQRNTTAIENAAWLRKQQSPFTNIHTLNPYTNIDSLLCELLNLPRVIYALKGEPFIFEGIQITVQGSERFNDLASVSISIYNQSTVAYSINNNTPFTLIDDNGYSYKYNPLQTSVLLPDTKQAVKLIFAVNPDSKSLHFKATTIDKYILADT
jgi:hypothetical protein